MSETLTAPTPATEENINIPLSNPIVSSIDDALDNMDKIRETKKGKKKEQPANENAGEGEDILNPPVETPSEKPAETPIDKKLEGETPAETKPKKSKFWKKEKEAVPANGVAQSEQTPATPQSKTELPPEIQKELENLRAIVNRPSVKTVLKAEESGKDYNTFREELESKNPMKMSYEDIYKIQLDRDGYSESEKARKLERFSEKDEDDQADIITHTRKELKAEFDKNINEYTPKFEVQENPVAKTWDTLASELPSAIKQIENKDYFGVQMTPERIKSLTDISKPIIKIDQETGRIDPQDFLRVKHIVENFDLIAETIEEQTRLEVTEEFNATYNLPLSAETGNHSPQPRQEQAHSSKRKEDMKELAGIK